MAKKQREPQQPTFDRVPPHSIEAERSVLGAMLLNPDAVGSAIEVLHDQSTDLFYGQAHQHIYGAIVQLFRKNSPVDEVTVVQQLTQDGHLDTAGGAAYVAELTNAVPTSANVEYYAKIVLDAAILRRIISSCTLVAGEAYAQQGEVNELLDRAEAEIFRIAQTRQLHPIYKIGDLLEDGIKRFEQLIKAHSGVTGLASGFLELDKMTMGFQKSDMIILAARPSVGKTAFALNIAAHAGVALQKNVLVFSLEMSKEQLTHRLLCMEGRINSRRLREGFLAHKEFPKLTHAADRLSRAAIFIDDTPNISVLDIRSKARRQAAQTGLDLLIIDYLQLMTGSSRAENRQVEIAEISRAVKGLARELSVPVIALSQLSREAEKDDTGTPKLAHLRESGAIEQDADVVMMLSRPPAHETEGAPDLLKLTLAKQRNGPTGVIELLFDRSIQRFKNVAEGDVPVAAPTDAGPPPDFDEMLDDDVPF